MFYIYFNMNVKYYGITYYVNALYVPQVYGSGQTMIRRIETYSH
jgi:hypothetical protein